jgi:hypothetical protein
MFERELAATAAAMVAPGKGILAIAGMEKDALAA